MARHASGRGGSAEIEEILADVRGEPFDTGIALENQLVCRQETLARIEGALASLVAPRLAALGTRIAGVTLDGLRVRIRLSGSPDVALARLIAESLRQYVCKDLEVEKGDGPPRSPRALGCAGVALRVERIPTWKDNYTYLLVCEATGEAAVVDAPEVEPVVQRVDEIGARVRQILSTHHHPDHSMANPELAKLYDAPVLGHASDRERLPGFTRGLDERDTVAVGNHVARVLHIPAHTRGHIAYVFDDALAVFSGDTMFAAGCGRLFEGTPEMMFAAFAKLGALPDAMRVFCGHEYTESNLVFAAHVEPENIAVRRKLDRVRALRAHAAADWHDATESEMTVPSTLAEERATNPFLRAADAAELGRRRALKDNFRG